MDLRGVRILRPRRRGSPLEVSAMFRTCFTLATVLTFLTAAAPPARAQGEAEKEALRLRAVLLTDKSYKKRIVALSKLEDFGPRYPGVLEDVIKILKRYKDEQLADDDLAEVRVVAAQWIGKTAKEGEEAKKGIPALRFALKGDPSDDVKEAAARSLGAFGADAEVAVEELGSVLLSKHAGLRGAAAESLRELKDKAVVVLPQILQALQTFKGKTDDPLDRLMM